MRGNGKQYTIEAELWTLGVLLWEMTSVSALPTAKLSEHKHHEAPLIAEEVGKGEHHKIGEEYSQNVHLLMEGPL